MSEAFVYLWYDALNKMYYLGKHKGSPEDTYTHSSTIWESFTKKFIPKGVRRRIHPDWYGTDEEMCILENKLLINRKNRCWDRYYNEGLGDPRYVDQSGENNGNWKGGISLDKKAYMKEYALTPKYKIYKKKYYSTPEYRVKELARQGTPEYKVWRKEYDAERNAKNNTERQGEGTLEAFL